MNREPAHSISKREGRPTKRTPDGVSVMVQGADAVEARLLLPDGTGPSYEFIPSAHLG